MKNLKYSVVLAVLALAVAPSSALWHKWQTKEKDVVVVPIQLQQVQPVQQIHHVEHVEQEQVQPINNEPGQIVKLWSHVKDKTIVPLKKIFTKKAPVLTPVTDYKVWPSLGFSHYKKVQYYPTQEHAIVDPQIALEFPKVYVEKIPKYFDGFKPYPVPIQPHHEYNVPYPPASALPYPSALPVTQQEQNVAHQEYNVPHQQYNVPHQEYNVPYPYPQSQESNHESPGSPGAEFAHESS